MPQFDPFVFPTIVIYLTIGLFLYFIFNHGYFLPRIVAIIKIRNKVTLNDLNKRIPKKVRRAARWRKLRLLGLFKIEHKRNKKMAPNKKYWKFLSW